MNKEELKEIVNKIIDDHKDESLYDVDMILYDLKHQYNLEETLDLYNLIVECLETSAKNYRKYVNHKDYGPGKIVSSFVTDDNKYVIIEFTCETQTPKNIKELYGLADNQAMFSSSMLDDKDVFYE